MFVRHGPPARRRTQAAASSLAALATLATLLAACGSSALSRPPIPASPVSIAAAAARTVAMHAATMTETLSGGVNGPGAPGGATGTVDFSAGVAVLDQSSAQGGKPIMYFSTAAVYLMNNFHTGGGTRWIEYVEPARGTAGADSPNSQLLANALYNPLWIMNLLKRPLPNRERALKPATVAGTSTYEYTAVLSLPQAAAATRSLATLFTQVKSYIGNPLIPAIVYVDARGILREISLQVPVPGYRGSAQSPLAATRVNVTFSQLGSPAKVSLPAPRTVAVES